MRLKRCIGLMTFVAALFFLGSLLANINVWAQAVAESFTVDGFTFFIPFPTEILDDQFDAGFAGDNLIGVDIETTISIAVHRSGTVIFFDHWEDGLESSLTAPIPDNPNLGR